MRRRRFGQGRRHREGGGHADSAKDDDTATAASKPKAADLELTVSRGAFAELGRATELLGSLRGANRLAGVPVVIEAAPGPFDGRFTSVRRVRTRSNGRFRLLVPARSNTTYRARAAGTRSPGTTVRVLPVPTYRLVLADPKTS